MNFSFFFSTQILGEGGAVIFRFRRATYVRMQPFEGGSTAASCFFFPLLRYSKIRLHLDSVSKLPLSAHSAVRALLPVPRCTVLLACGDRAGILGGVQQQRVYGSAGRITQRGGEGGGPLPKFVYNLI